MLISLTEFQNDSSSYFPTSAPTLFVTIRGYSMAPPLPGQKSHSCQPTLWWWWLVCRLWRWWVRYDKFVKFLLGHKKLSFHPVTLSDKSPAIIKYEHIHILCPKSISGAVSVRKPSNFFTIHFTFTLTDVVVLPETGTDTRVFVCALTPSMKIWILFWGLYTKNLKGPVTKDVKKMRRSFHYQTVASLHLTEKWEEVRV